MRLFDDKRESRRAEGCWRKLDLVKVDEGRDLLAWAFKLAYLATLSE
jgi:hypothetical protein